MLNCPECAQHFPSLSAYKLHLDKSHRSEYSCIQGDCKTASRSFDTWESLRKHISTAHKADIEELKNVPPSKKKVPSSKIDPSEKLTGKRPTSHSGDGNVHKKITLKTISETRAATFSFVFTLLFKFCAFLYSRNVARSLVQDVIEIFRDFMEKIIKHLKEELKNKLKSENVPEDIINKTLIILNDVLGPFENFRSEHMRLKELKKRGFIEPESFVIGACDTPKSRGNSLEFVSSTLTGQFIPLRKTFQQFFSMKLVLKTVLEFTKIQELNCGLYSNFVHGKYWQEKRFNGFFKDKQVIPFNIYFDEFEVNNPLGSHKNIQRVGAVYCYFPTLPEQYRSRLENIFLVCLFNANDKNDNDRSFHLLVDEINFLQDNGLLFEVDGKKETVYFALGLITGDNKGINDILGFSDFGAKYYCRFCKSETDDNKKDCELKENLLRKREVYEKDVSDGPHRTGVKENSIWNKVKFFHVYWNYFVDSMHDLSEGVFKYDMGHILNYMIMEKKWFTVSQLNERMDQFNYHFFSIRNRPPSISQINVEKRKMSMSASEMVTFVKLFAFFVGDFVDKNDDVWRFYLSMRRLYDIIASPIFQQELINTIPNLVKEHHTLYKNLFKDTLKPKFHHLLHYAMCILMSGPLKWLCALRGEAKHQAMKNIARTTTSRKNILYTIALKEQINVCFRFNSGEPGLKDNIDMGPCSLFDMKDYYSELTAGIPKSLVNDSVELEWVQINGKTYKVGSFILADVPDGSQPIFGIIKIIILKEDSYHVVYRKLHTEIFDESLFAYYVTSTNEYSCCNINSLYRLGTLAAKELSNGKTYVLADKAL